MLSIGNYFTSIIFVLIMSFLIDYYALGALIRRLGLRCSKSVRTILGADEPESFDSGVDDMPREAKSMLGKSVRSEVAFFGGGLVAWSWLAVVMLLGATWRGGGPGGCTSSLVVGAALVGNGTDRALARVWRT